LLSLDTICHTEIDPRPVVWNHFKLLYKRLESVSTNSVLLITIDSLRRDFLGTYRDRPRMIDCADALSELDAHAEQFERYGLS
jgi:hypothetical protein